MDIMIPPAEDIKLAGGYLQRLEDSDIPINKILSLHYLLAKADYQYRKSNTIRASEHARAALDVAREINLQEFTEHAQNRVLKLNVLHTPYSLTLQEINDEQEFNELLMEDTESRSESGNDSLP